MSSVWKGLHLLSRSLVHANSFDFIPGPVESTQPNTQAFRVGAGLTDSMLLLAWAELSSLTKSHSIREVRGMELVGLKADNTDWKKC